MANRPFLKKLKQDAKQLDLKKLFPRTNVKLNRKLTNYQVRKIKKALAELKIPKGAASFKPDRPQHYEAAGFESDGEKIYYTTPRLKLTHHYCKGGKIIFYNPTKIRIEKVYQHKGNFSFYFGSFFMGTVYVQLMPLSMLPDFLEQEIKRVSIWGQTYDKITLREGDRGMHDEQKGFEKMHDSADELLLKLLEYKRHGALIGEGGTFDYIQVCFINFN